jgi:hypothetical protein
VGYWSLPADFSAKGIDERDGAGSSAIRQMLIGSSWWLGLEGRYSRFLDSCFGRQKENRRQTSSKLARVAHVRIFAS